ncbi:MAG: hypothetical protein FGM45_04340 [Actinobacteria bacterium]|nr:hypothetical protein [Actinomycetota bacterium]
MSTESVYRVTVRGRFAGLDEKTRAYLAREQPEHDIFKSAYTTEGTFTYDTDIRFFNLRYEVRTAAGTDEAENLGLTEAEAFLRTLGYGFEKLKVNVVDTSAMWHAD